MPSTSWRPVLANSSKAWGVKLGESHKDPRLWREAFSGNSSEKSSDDVDPDLSGAPALALDNYPLPVTSDLKIDVAVGLTDRARFSNVPPFPAKYFAYKPFEFRRVQTTQVSGPVDKVAAVDRVEQDVCPGGDDDEGPHGSQDVAKSRASRWAVQAPEAESSPRTGYSTRTSMKAPHPGMRSTRPASKSIHNIVSSPDGQKLSDWTSTCWERSALRFASLSDIVPCGERMGRMEDHPNEHEAERETGAATHAVTA